MPDLDLLGPDITGQKVTNGRQHFFHDKIEKTSAIAFQAAAVDLKREQALCFSGSFS